MSLYNFPFNTCEKVQTHGIAQPYSASINIITCCVLVYFLTKTKSKEVFLFLFLFLVFEILHTFSHMIHITGNIQKTLIHFLAVITNISFFNLYCSYSKSCTSIMWVLFTIAIIIDIYLFFTYSFIISVLTTIFIFLVILFNFYLLLSGEKKKYIWMILFASVVLLLTIFNEKVNGKKMLDSYPNVPFHIVLENIGLFIVFYVCKVFYNVLDNK
tara:strand:+ start:2069 stop:2710 length:642 start_codon:yes stop_codon:yes gene_type:complete